MVAGFSWGRTKPPAGTRINRAHPLANSLRMAWLMNEGAGNPVEQLNLITPSSVTTTPIPWRGGALGHGLYFPDGDSWAAYPVRSYLNHTTSFSIEAWVRPVANGGDHRIIQIGTDDDTRLCISGGVLTFRYEFRPADATVMPTDGQLHHVVGTAALGEKTKLYLDGVQIAESSGNLTTTRDFTNLTAYIGAKDGSWGGDNWRGGMELVRVWAADDGSGELSAAQVRALYGAPFDMYTPPVWRRGALSAAGLSAIVSGTATASITEADIVAGGKTVIITLTGTTWNED